MRPTTLEEFVGQHHLVGAGATLRALIEADRLSSAVFFGPGGLGQDDARPDRGGCLGQGLRPALGDRGRGEGRPRDPRGGAARARHDGAGHDPFPRRDPPLLRVPAGRAPAGGRGGRRRADRRDHGEPVLRAQRRRCCRARRCGASTRSATTTSPRSASGPRASSTRRSTPTPSTRAAISPTATPGRC